MMKKCTPLWCEAHFQVKMYKTLGDRTTFGGSDVEFRKSARRCGAKHISKSKCTKHTRFGPLLAVAMSKKRIPLWREAHFEVKMYKAHHSWTTFGSWLRCRRSALRCGAKHISKSKCQKHTRFGALLEVQMSKKCTPLWREAHFQVKMYKTHQVWTTFKYNHHYTTLHSNTLHSIALNYTQLHPITLHYITLHSATLNYTPLHYLPLH